MNRKYLIQHALLRQDKTERKLADEIGRSHQHLCSVITGKLPLTEDMAQRLANNLGLSYDDLRAST